MKEQRFWDWFAANSPRLLAFERDQDRIFSELHRQLKKVDEDLVFEFGPPEPQREFVISADGIQRAFPSVLSVTAAAPKLHGWRFTAFRPRRADLQLHLQLGDVTIDTEQVEVSLLEQGNLAGIYLYLPGYQDAEMAFKQAGYVLLDDALGEFDVETKVGTIEIVSPDADVDFERFPFSRLPERFDELTERLAGRSGKPS
jgi:hypothetical protein